MLMAIESPYLTGQAPDPADTIIFLRICSNTDTDIASIKPSWFDRLVSLKLHHNMRFHASLVRAIIEYMKDYCSSPKTVIRGRDGKETIIEKRNVPEMLLLSSLCMAKLHMSEDEALSMGIGKMSWYAATIAMMEGADVRVISTEEEESAMDDLEALARWEREQAEKLRLAMVNGKIPKRTIKLASQ